MQKKFINPETMPPTFGYSHVVEVSNAKRTIYISGQVAINIDGQIRLMCSFKTNCIFIVLNIIYIWRHYHQQLIKQQISTQLITQNESNEKGSVTI